VNDPELRFTLKKGSMKNKMKTAVLALTMVGSGILIYAQEQGSPSSEQKRGHRPPPFPLLEVLDKNHDRIIDASEISNAVNALRSLDKNGDGKLTPEEFAPPRPPHSEGTESDHFPPGPPSEQR
jgi:EF hand